MPLIQVRVIKDVFTKEQKSQIISKRTDAMVAIEGECMRGVTWCMVEEARAAMGNRRQAAHDHRRPCDGARKGGLTAKSAR